MHYIVWVLLAIYFVIPVILYFLVPKDPVINPRKRAIVLVLGDIGRSPRMQYHVLSLVETGFEVYFCGYTETEPLLAIKNSPSVTIKQIKTAESLKIPSSVPFIFRAVVKVFYLTYQLFTILKPLRNSEYLLVQNPPSLPTMFVAFFFTRYLSRRTRFVIDWHNFGYTVLGLKLGNDNILVRISKWYEHFFGRLAFANFTVTKAMAEVLVEDMGVNPYRIIPLHDRPANQFQPLSAEKRADVIKTSAIFNGFDFSRDRIVITSTSYTPDEDLNVLLDALSEYDSVSSVRLLVIVTGKGPLQDEFIANVSKRSWRSVTVRTVWLTAEEYPVIIGTADVGVSLHLSTSGWDLPMKVVDMFGCGIPVLARNFPALPELVVAGRNGQVFDSASDLANLLNQLTNNPQELLRLRKGALTEGGNRWNEQWRITAGPVFHIPNREDFTEVYSSSSDEE
ncbi:hypothetical protein V1514DRAFT_332553 [Lipomyces japonicus]|uniref:uncharacterized protein n=1 Tax=Lipomyces japonicus TaxID=56871 RepID=UPI0034CE63AB